MSIETREGNPEQIHWEDQLKSLSQGIDGILARAGVSSFVHTLQIVRSVGVTLRSPESHTWSCNPAAFTGAVEAFIRSDGLEFTRSLVGLDYDDGPYWYAELSQLPLVESGTVVGFDHRWFPLDMSYDRKGKAEVQDYLASWVKCLRLAFSNRGATMWVPQAHYGQPGGFSPVSSAFLLFNQPIPESVQYRVAKLVRDFLVWALGHYYAMELGIAHELNVALLRDVMGKSITLDELGSRIKQKIETIEKAILSPYPILITGESGTGKLSVASAIHDIREKWFAQNRPNDACAQPLRRIHLSGLSSPHQTADDVRGAIEKRLGLSDTSTHAQKEHVWKKGTIVFDDIHAASALAQDVISELLNEPPATSNNQAPGWLPLPKPIFVSLPGLSNSAASGRFSSSLLTQIQTFEIVCPPLRERRDELKALALRIIKQLKTALNHPDDFELTEDQERYVTNHTWPGNFRELQGYLAHALLTKRKT